MYSDGILQTLMGQPHDAIFHLMTCGLALAWHQRVPKVLALGYALRFFAVFADWVNALAVGAPLAPGLRIRSGFLPAAFWAAMRLRFL